VPQEDSRHLLPFVNLGHTRGAQAVMDWKFSNRKSATMGSGHELPPESLLHLTKLVRQPFGNSLPHQDKRAARIVNWRTKYSLVENEEEPGEDSSNHWVRAVGTPADQDIRRFSNVPEAGKISGIALSI
jgi:hypothetical protein